MVRDFNVVSVYGGSFGMRVGGGTIPAEALSQGVFVLTPEGRLSKRLPGSQGEDSLLRQALVGIRVGDLIVEIESEAPIAGDRSSFSCLAWKVLGLEGGIALTESVPFEASQLPGRVFEMLRAPFHEDAFPRGDIGKV